MSGPAGSAATGRRWLLRPPRPDARARLFCLPYSGCGASMYHQWPRRVGGLEICPVQLPGRENRIRESPHETYEELAADLIAGLGDYLDRPFGFFGHCGAALPCYEAAAQLCAAGGPVPTRLFVSSQVAPHEGPHGRFLMMDDAALSAEMQTLIRQLGGEPLPDFVAMGLRVLRADVEANKRYRLARPRPLSCPTTVIGWSDDAEVPAGLMSGWSEYGSTSFHLLTGAHYQFLRAPAELLAVLAEGLAEASARHTDAAG